MLNTQSWPLAAVPISVSSTWASQSPQGHPSSLHSLILLSRSWQLQLQNISQIHSLSTAITATTKYNKNLVQANFFLA